MLASAPSSSGLARAGPRPLIAMAGVGDMLTLDGVGIAIPDGVGVILVGVGAINAGT
jgi:hypothetical protein